jgi:hypothetical protein
MLISDHSVKIFSILDLGFKVLAAMNIMSCCVVDKS